MRIARTLLPTRRSRGLAGDHAVNAANARLRAGCRVEAMASG